MADEISNAEQERREELATIAHSHVRVAVFQAVQETGGQLVDRPVIRGRTDCGTLKDASPADGLVIARAIELQARRKVRDYIRDSREAGLGWRKIGELLNLQHEADAREISVADAAYDLAAGPVDTGFFLRERTFPWRCQTCGQLISDHGPEEWPEAGKGGHAKGCHRLAAEVREYRRSCS